MKTIVCFGDSVTLGIPHVAADDTFPRLLERRLNQRPSQEERVLCINSGVGGENTVEGLARLRRAVLDHEPHLVVVEFGLNDLRYEPEKTVSPEDFAASLGTIHDRITQTGATVVFTTPNPIINAFHGYSQNTDYYDRWGGCNGAVVEYAAVVRDTAAQLGAHLCDVYRVFEDQALALEFSGACASYQDLRCLAPYIKREDGVHPTAPGHQLIAGALYGLIVREDLLA
ncbi:SGNH/GDSL hydrolase family protein [bacterium]|nr:SGNH/GDSL hydrolase family protein [bacterium]